MSCSNSGFIGYPILLLSMAPIAPVAFALNLLVEQLVMLPLLLALFIVGGTLFGLPVRGMGWRIAPVVIGKLAGHPLTVLLAHLLPPIMGIPATHPDLRTAAVLTAAVPMLSTYTILAQAHDEDEATAPAMLVTTVASFFTLSGLLYLLL